MKAWILKNQTPIEVFPFADLQEALIRVKHGKVNGNAVKQISEDGTI